MSGDGDLVEFGRFRLHRRGRTLLADGLKLDLGARAIDVLLALIDAGGAVMSNQVLLNRVWPDAVVDENNLHVQIVTLRRALGADRDLIRTVPRHGYCFMGHVTAGATSAVVPVDIGPSVSPARAAPGVPVDRGPSMSPSINLPIPVGELIGREADLRQVVELLTMYRLVTLAGPGGIGKTSLALAAAWRLVDRFPDGVRLADLATLADPNLTPSAIATALDLQELPSPLLAEHVAARLASRQLLLVLDNCEHLIEPVARIAETLLHGAPHVRILATSREFMRAEGECVYRVPALAVPGDEVTDTEAQLGHSAVRLFVARAHLGGARGQLDDDDTRTISSICRRLDGLPLAIELAAARAVVLGVQSMAASLDDRFRALTGGRRTALPRHQTLRATLDWSYELLSENERAVLRGLAIFPGAFEPEAAKAIIATTDGEAPDIVDSLANLFVKSLLARDTDSVPVRYRLLDTTRAYARGKLAECGQLDITARRHAEYYQDLFERAETEWETRSTTESLGDYGREVNNLRAALDWAFSSGGDASIGVALTAAAIPLWTHLSLMEECRLRVERALAECAGRARKEERSEMQLNTALAASLMYTRGAVPEVGAAGAKALEVAESLGHAEYQMRSIFGLWSYRINSGQQRIGLDLANRFQALATNRSDPNDGLIAERMIGTSQYLLGNLSAARYHLDRVLRYDVALASKWRIVRFEVDQRVAARAYLARILWLQGLPYQAMQNAELSVADARATGHAVSVGLALALAACPIALITGDLVMSEHYIKMLLDHSTTHALARWHAFGRNYQAMLVMRRDDFASGLELLRAAFDDPAGAGSVPRFFGAFIADALGRDGRVAQGLAAAEDAIDRAERSEEHWEIAELLRIKGELVLLQDVPGASAAAESLFRQALDRAHRQGALSWALRCAMSLARLWRGQPQGNSSLELLASVYDRFTEGFDTADLKAARTLLGRCP